jgi:esterase/lipase superfamily enzyme
MTARRYNRRTLLLLLGAAALVPPAPSFSADRSGAALAGPAAYSAVDLDETGQAHDSSLDALVASLRGTVQARSHIVLMVHGFNTNRATGQRQYSQIARDLRREAGLIGLEVVPVGVHWDAHPGPILKWLPRVIAYRFVAELGFRRALKNPYLGKVKLAGQAGRLGLRPLLLRLRRAFPGCPVHILSHSLGSEAAVRALAPDEGDLAPGELPKVDLAALAGADLDSDVFVSREGTARLALPQARVWWVTVPREARADAALELRRGAGRRDAMGNVGVSLRRPDFKALMERRALILDDERIPIAHDINQYFDRPRLTRLVRSMLYLRQPAAPEAAASELALLDRLRAMSSERLAPWNSSSLVSARLYCDWRAHPGAREFGAVTVLDRDSS